MKKILLLALAAALLLAGCTKEGKPTQEIRLSTAATTGALYPLGGALASLWGENLEGVRVTAQASAGGIENLRLLAEGEAELGFAVTSLLWEAQQGEGSFEGAPNDQIRVLAGLYYNPNQVVVTEQSGAQAMEDLEGLRFAPGTAGSTTSVETEIHLEQLGIDYPDGIQAQFVGFTEAEAVKFFANTYLALRVSFFNAVELMRNRQLDGAWVMAGLGNAAVTEIMATADGRLLSMDDSLIEALQEKYPWYARYVIPAGTYANQEEDVVTSAIKLALFCSAELDEQTAYELTRIMWENMDTLQQSIPALEGVELQDAVTDLAQIPLHEGARRYYEEQGLLPAQEQ